MGVIDARVAYQLVRIGPLTGDLVADRVIVPARSRRIEPKVQALKAVAVESRVGPRV